MGSPVLPWFSLCTCRRHYPGEAAGCLSFSSPAVAAFPVAPPGQPSHRCFRGLLNVHSHYSPHTRGVALTTLSIGGFRPVVAFPPAPTATGRNDPCREGLAPSQEPCLSTAHGARTTRLRRPRDSALVSRTIRVHHSPPRVRDDRDTPLAVGRDTTEIAHILKNGSQIFSARGLDRKSAGRVICPSGTLGRSCKRRRFVCAVIASAAKQSRPSSEPRTGLLHCARNDDGRHAS